MRRAATIVLRALLLLVSGQGFSAEEGPASPFGRDAKNPGRGEVFTASLSGRWRFSTDPDNVGEKLGWQKGGFDDSSWAWIETGKTWQSQGWNYGGYAWYRAEVFIPAECAGVPMEVKLGDIREDDDVYLNGIRIGSMRGAYKYENLVPRSYTALPAEIHYGALNTIAVRVWGAREGVFRSESGIISKDIEVKIDPQRVLAVGAGDDPSKAVPVERFDLSEAQRQLAFDLVLPMPLDLVGKAELVDWEAGDISEDFSKRAANPSFDFQLFPPGPPQKPFAEGQSRVAGDRAVLSIDADLARRIYLNGRFSLVARIRDAGGKDLREVRWQTDRLRYAARDVQELPSLPSEEHETPFGKLRLVDEIDAAVPVSQDPHPYLQGGFEEPRFRRTPGSPVDVTVGPVLGREARESSFGWFAYRIGRGKLVPGQPYLLRVEYPEDKPRYFPIELETGLDYSGIGWTGGVSKEDPYNNWPLSKTWRWHDAIVIAGERTLGSDGAEGAPGDFGFWVYFINKVAPGKYFTMYEGGPAVARVRLYALDAEKNAPRITRPTGLPERTLMFDWERQPLQPAANLVRYAQLMGYNAISPLLLKWGFTLFGESMSGYDTAGVDAHGYYVKSGYDQAAKTAPAPVVPGMPSVHRQFLDATKGSGVRYIPRIEYGGSYDLPKEARALGADGKTMPTSRFIPWGANLLNPATWEDLKTFLDKQIKPYLNDYPELAGVLWRIRSDRMLPSYGPADLELFSKETGTPLPSGDDKVRGAWAHSGEGALAYRSWWLKKRAEFHYKVRDLLAGYRPGFQFLYYNWDGDKWSLIIPDFHSGFFYKKLLAAKGRAAEVYAADAAERSKLTGTDYVAAVRSGQIFPAPPVMNLDRALDMDLYRDAGSMEPLCPADYLYLAGEPDYVNYFQTDSGLAVSHAVAYDELGHKSFNPKYECNMPTPGGGNFSMALEVLAWFHGDARTLTWTPYTYGRGFAAEHRRFAQAFLSLPAIAGTAVDHGDEDIKVRTYASEQGTYVGVASKHYEGRKFTVRIPARSGTKVTNLVTNEPVASKVAGEELTFEVESGPMELNAFLVL